MEACAGAHHWARELGKLGHTVRLIPPAYVKPFVKRQKNDAADAEAICEAAQRPTMRFVPVKSEAQQADAVVFRARDLLVHRCCTGRGSGRTDPYPVRGQATRTDSGRPGSNMRLRAWTPTLTSVARRRSVRECSPSPITRLYREMAASARARSL